MIYTVQSSLATDEPIMLISKHIGYDAVDGTGVDGSLFQQELLELDGMGKKRIQVWINSPGGVVMDGYNIFNAILKSNTPVDTYNVGICASIAGVIFMAGRKRVMSDYAKFMMHNPFGGDDKKQLDAMKSSLVTMLASKSSIAEPEVDMLMGRTTWMSAAECFASGFCTEIDITSENNKKRMPANDSRAMWKESNLILNNIFKISNKMIKVTNKLGLQAEANEDSIVEAINAMQAKTKVEVDNAKNEMEQAKAKASEMEEKYNSLKAQFDEAEAKAKSAEEEMNTANATNMVENFAKIGVIKNDADTKNEWIETAKNLGIEKVKSMLAAIPLNKVANKIEVGGDANESNLVGVAAKAMLEQRNKLGL